MEEPLIRCKKTKNDFRYSNPRCLYCIDQMECQNNSVAVQKEQKLKIRTIPWEIIQLRMSNAARYVSSVIWCHSNTKRIKPKRMRDKEAIMKRGKQVKCNLTYAEIKKRWGRDVTDECLRQHLIELIKFGIIERKWGGIYVNLDIYNKWDATKEITETGRWDSGLVIPAIIHNDNGLSDTEKIVLSGLLAFPTISIVDLSKKLGISRRTITRIKAKIRMGTPSA